MGMSGVPKALSLCLTVIDLKATALLKLIYLEMFGHDMSWASFHVLEVMSSSKHFQKRVGYLGAVQSFRPDTEVLMLATNMLKKVTCIVLIWLFYYSERRTSLLPPFPRSPFLSSLSHMS